MAAPAFELELIMDNEKAAEDQLNQLKRWCMGFNDLQMALSSLTFLHEELDYDQEKYHYVELRRMKCFELSFVVSYARAFTDSNGSRYKRISLKGIGVSLSEREKATHDRIINIRNKIYAHSDQEFYILRADHHEMDLKGVPFSLTNIRADEGLQFTDLFENIHTMDMISCIMKHLYEKINEAANQHKDVMPILLSRTATP